MNSNKNGFEPKLLTELLNNNSLKSILENISEIDFMEIFHRNTVTARRVDKYNEIINTLPLNSELREKTEKELKKLDPKVEYKITIAIERLIGITNFLKIGLCSHEGLPYFYNGNHWQGFDDKQISILLAEVANRMGINRFEAYHHKNAKTLFDQFSLVATLPNSLYDKNTTKINLINGTFVINSEIQELQCFNSADLLKYQLSFNYDSDAKAPLFEKFLNEVLPDIKDQMILAEYIGYVFVKGLKLEKCLVLIGSGSNGKSVVYEIVSALLGENNICSYTLSNLCDNRGYYRAQLSSKLLNYSSELGGNGCDPDTVKKLISNEPIDARSPFGRPFELKDYCKLMFNTNSIPQGVEQSNAYYRRFIYLTFNVIIPEERRDPDLAKKIIANELSGVFNWVLQGLKRILESKKFTYSENSIKAIENIKRDTDSVALFMYEENYKKSHDDRIALKTLYEYYLIFCRENTHKAVSKRVFSKRLDGLGFQIDRNSTNNGTFVHCILIENLGSYQETSNIIENLMNKGLYGKN